MRDDYYGRVRAMFDATTDLARVGPLGAIMAAIILTTWVLATIAGLAVMAYCVLTLVS